MTEWFANHILGMPELASKNGEAVDALIVYVHWLMLALFIGWIIYFGYAVWRFRASRNPKANYHGVKNHASSYIELGVVVAEAVLLIGVAIPVWAKAVNQFPDAKDSTVIYVMGQQFAWNVRYAGPDGQFGKQDMKFVSWTTLLALTRPTRTARTTSRRSTKSMCRSTNRSSSMSVPRT